MTSKKDAKKNPTISFLCVFFASLRLCARQIDELFDVISTPRVNSFVQPGSESASLIVVVLTQDFEKRP
jgi:hypothetical protein